MSFFSGQVISGAAPAASAPANPFGGFGAPATSTPGNLFGGFGAASTATSAPATAAPTISPFGAASAAATTASSLYPTLTTSAPTTSAPSLFATAPSTLSTGSLFGGSSSTTAANTLGNATAKNPLATSSVSTAPAVALTPDTIAGSTKYTELPADAKTTLDQFHTFLQGQIHLSTTLTARPSESLDKISKDTTELSKRLETLNDALERDTKIIRDLQDKVVQEFKQADSAGRIIEAYTNTSHANFLYAGNNSAGQYFTERCLDFEEQLRQYRSTIEEIERHLASFGSRNPQVSYALPEVMRNQHEGFLAVAGRVAALHDEIKDREKAYLIFRRRYFDDDTDPFQANNKHRKTDTVHHGHSLRSSGRSPEGQKSFREIAKETLRPGSGVSATPAAAPAAGSSLFSTAPALGSTSLLGKPTGFGSFGATTSAAPTFSLTAPSAPSTGLFGAPATSAAAAPSTGLFGAPSTSAPATGLFGAPAASAPATGLFGAPAASAPATGLFGAPAPATATPFGGLKLGGK
ncbi:Nucleoporin p58/p45 [Linnemannia zychae]|nr:Nucleoporin p58/p45 [Linnemannia zychae]